jgi:hypothetical protein
MRTKDELTREVQARNKLRAETGLPLVSVAKEVRKLHAAELWQDYRTWVDRNPDLLASIEAEELERERRERYDPTWEPRALLNGAGAFGSKVQDRMLSLWKAQQQARKSLIE